MTLKPTCLVRLSTDTLLVANTGRPFGNLDVAAICRSNLGTKGETKPGDPCPRRTGKEVIDAIVQEELRVYESSPDRAREDANREDETADDYRGRVLWELIQNADDANAEAGQSIGHKGLGFKAVLGLTREPEVYSGSFSFRFSADATDLVLQQIWATKATGAGVPRSPTFRLPHWNPSPPDDVLTLFSEGFASVIRLPLRRGVFEVAEGAVAALRPELLLFLPHIERLVVQRAGLGDECFERVVAQPEATDIVVRSTRADGSVETATHSFAVWTERAAGHSGRLEAAIALPRKGGRAVALDDETHLNVFFPTDDPSPFKAWVHGAFALDSNRKHVRLPADTDVLAALSRAIAKLANSAPAEVVLESLVPRKWWELEGIAAELWSCSKSVLSATSFVPTVGGRKRMPAEVRLWGHELATVVNPSSERIRSAGLADPSLSAAARKALELLDARELSVDETVDLLADCRRDTAEECATAVGVLAACWRARVEDKSTNRPSWPDFRSAVTRVPCWWIGGSVGGRSLSEHQRPIFWPPPEGEDVTRADLPEWASVDVLDERFVSQCGAVLESLKSEAVPPPWSSIRPWEPGSLLNVIAETIIALDTDDWREENWWQLLRLVARLVAHRRVEDLSPIWWSESPRSVLAKAVKVPTSQGWLPGECVYAGTSWGGPQSFDTYWLPGRHHRRGLVADYANWPETLRGSLTADECKVALRYLGVSWEPKLRRSEEKPRRRLDKTCPPAEDLGTTGSSDWSSYLGACENLLGEKWRENRSVKEQMWLEHFPDCLPADPESTLACLRPAAEAIESGGRLNVYSYKENATNPRDKVPFFASFQLKDTPWVRLRETSIVLASDRAAPSSLFVPGGDHDFVPSFPISLKAGDIVLRSFLLKNLGVRGDPPAPKDATWLCWLKALPSTCKTDTQLRQAKALYRHVLDGDEWPEDLDKIDPVLCLSDDAAGLAFRPRSQIIWFDETWLDDPGVRLGLQRLELYALPFPPKSKQRRLGIARLGIVAASAVVRVECRFDAEDRVATRRLLARYEERRPALRALRDACIPAASELRVRVVPGLRVEIFDKRSGDKVATVAVPDYKAGDGTHLVSGDLEPWLAAGKGIADMLGGQLAADQVENLLRAETPDEVLQRLKNANVSESALQEAAAELKSEAQTRNASGAEEVAVAALSSPPVVGEGVLPLAQVVGPQRVAEVRGSGTLAGSASPPRDRPRSEPRRITGADRGPPPTNGPMGAGRAESARSNRGSDSGPDPRPAVGRHAEKWLRDTLHEEVTGWNISDAPERDGGREWDIGVRRPDGLLVMIEVKHIARGTIYWSEQEASLARENPHYVIALVEGDAPDSYDVRWLFAPMADLRSEWLDGRVNLELAWKTQIGVDGRVAEPWTIPPGAENEAGQRGSSPSIRFVVDVGRASEHAPTGIAALQAHLDALPASG